MTTLLRTSTGNDAGAIEPTPDQLRLAVRRALDRAGCANFDQLAAQARSGSFSTTRARMAWVAIGGLREYS